MMVAIRWDVIANKVYHSLALFCGAILIFDRGSLAFDRPFQNPIFLQNLPSFPGPANAILDLYCFINPTNSQIFIELFLKYSNCINIISTLLLFLAALNILTQSLNERRNQHIKVLRYLAIVGGAIFICWALLLYVPIYIAEESARRHLSDEVGLICSTFLLIVGVVSSACWMLGTIINARLPLRIRQRARRFVDWRPQARRLTDADLHE
jgi:hypothetical protein